jgi:hypothetical protein
MVATPAFALVILASASHPYYTANYSALLLKVFSRIEQIVKLVFFDAVTFYVYL